MGKTKRKKHFGKKVEPTPLPSVRDIKNEDEVAESEEDTLLQSIMEKLQSHRVENKEAGCLNLSMAVEHYKDNVLSLIVQYEVVRVVAPLVVDLSVVVRHAAAGALRNLSAAGHDVCESMVEQDVMTPLVTLFNQFYRGWVPRKRSNERIDSKLETLVDAVHLLLNLCESSEKALSIFNREDLLPIIIQFINSRVFGNDLAIAAARCLHTISEENPKAIELLSQPSLSLPIETLISQSGDGDFTSILLKSLAAGILLNIHHGKLSSCPVNILSVIVGVISQTLEYDCASLVIEFMKKRSLIQNDGLEDEVIRPNLEQEEKKIVEERTLLYNALSAQVVVLEMLTNICCSDGGDDWDDLDSSDASDEMFNCDDVEMNDCDEKFPLSVAAGIHEAILSYDLVTKVLKKTCPISIDNGISLDPNHQTIIKKVIDVQCRALLCVHNLISCLDIEDIGGSTVLTSIWTELAKLIFNYSPFCPCGSERKFDCESSQHVQFLEASTSALRAILEKMAQSKCMDLAQIGVTELGMFSKLAESCPDSSVRINVINIMGTIGQVFAQLPKNEQMLAILKDIGQFLLEISTKELPDLIVNAEAVDAIFDVFADDDTNQLIIEINLIERLKQMLPVLKHKLRTQRKCLGAHYLVIATAKTNLIRFIKYKTELNC